MKSKPKFVPGDRVKIDVRRDKKQRMATVITCAPNYSSIKIDGLQTPRRDIHNDFLTKVVEEVPAQGTKFQVSNIATDITLPTQLHTQAVALLLARGTTLDQFIAMQLTALIRCKVLRLADLMNFGRYATYTVEQVVRNEPGYLAWYLGLEGTSKKFHPEVLELLETILKEI